MVMGYANNYFVNMMEWMYAWCGQITPGDLMRNQEEMQATYNFQDPINILFDQIKMGQ